MKSKLQIAGLILVSSLIFSCSSDDSYEIPEVKKSNFKIESQSVLKNESGAIAKDSTIVAGKDESDGEPSNPIPPRR